VRAWRHLGDRHEWIDQALAGTAAGTSSAR